MKITEMNQNQVFDKVWQGPPFRRLLEPEEIFHIMRALGYLLGPVSYSGDAKINHHYSIDKLHCDGVLFMHFALQDPKCLDFLANQLAIKYRGMIKQCSQRPDYVCTFEEDSDLGRSVARRLHTRHLPLWKYDKEKNPCKKQASKLEGKKVLVVFGDSYSWHSNQEHQVENALSDLVWNCAPMSITGALMIFKPTNYQEVCAGYLSLKIESLGDLDLNLWPIYECKLCAMHRREGIEPHIVPINPFVKERLEYLRVLHDNPRP